MSQVFAAFGVDWRLLLINVMNFSLLLLALWYFLYTPIMAMLERRRSAVAQGVADAHAANEKLKEIEQSRAQVLADAAKESDTLLLQARASAGAKERELVAEAQKAATRIVDEAQLQAVDLKVQTLAESKQEVAKLIVLGMERMAQTK